MAQMILMNVYAIDGAPQNPSNRMAFPVQHTGVSTPSPVAIGGVNMYGLLGTDVIDGVHRKYAVRETVTQIATAANA